MNKDALALNYRAVMNNAAASAARVGRADGSWRLVAVTKTVDIDVAAVLADLGAADFGENRVQELKRKTDALASRGLCWHMIGHLQRNKVKKVVGPASLIHSVDSPRLAEEIERVAAEREVTQDVLLEVNIAGEDSKYGLTADAARDLAGQVAAMPHVRLVGLMTMAPIVADAEETRPFFAALRELGDRLAAEGRFAGEGFHLSMGMTQDYEIAIEEGATLIRVGSALFRGVSGERR
jgi:pyridoxal phosphate enzyme (YggS family)